jgi:hypothetical protein
MTGLIRTGGGAAVRKSAAEPPKLTRAQQAEAGDGCRVPPSSNSRAVTT